MQSGAQGSETAALGYPPCSWEASGAEEEVSGGMIWVDFGLLREFRGSCSQKGHFLLSVKHDTAAEHKALAQHKRACSQPGKCP